MLVALKRSPNELSSYQQKVFKIDDHIGISVSGLTADGRILSRFMRRECINHKFTFDSPMIVGRLVLDVADKSQVSLPSCCHYYELTYGTILRCSVYINLNLFLIHVLFLHWSCNSMIDMHATIMEASIWGRITGCWLRYWQW